MEDLVAFKMGVLGFFSPRMTLLHKKEGTLETWFTMVKRASPKIKSSPELKQLQR